jgi:hypothetical protein
MTDLRTRIAAALRNMTGDLTYEAMADAVIREIDLGIPCFENGCRMRQVAQQAAKRHAESSSRLEYGTHRRRSAEKLGLIDNDD